MKITAARPLVLGSASPRRRELLALAGVPFVVRSADIDESIRPDEALAGGHPYRAYLERVAQAKLEAVCAGLARSAEGAESAAVLVADTVVVAPDGSILGKPRDPAHARAMIQQLAGETHDVSTRFVLALANAPPAHAETVTTRVRFRALSSAEVRDYAATGEGSDKAGAYAVQGGAAAFVERIEGSYTNIVGLPLCEVVVALRRLGWL